MGGRERRREWERENVRGIGGNKMEEREGKRMREGERRKENEKEGE